MALEWLSIPAGVIAGVGSGWAAAWLNRPSAAAAADVESEQTRLRFEERRRRIAEARTLAAEANLDDDVYAGMQHDARYTAVRRHLSDLTRDVLEYRVMHFPRPPAVHPVNEFLTDLDRLEDEWGLL